MKIKDIVSKRLDRFQSKASMTQGVIGNVGTGKIEVPGKTGYIYVTLNSGTVLSNVVNTRFPNLLGSLVNIGYDPNDKASTLQVLGTRDFYVPNIDDISKGANWHHKQHEWPGGDTVYVQGPQILPSLFVPVPETVTVAIYPGSYAITGGYKIYSQATIVDMASSIAGVTSGHARLSVIVVDASGDFQVRDGSLVAEQTSPFISAYMMLADTDLPALTAGDTAVCAIRLYPGQTEFICNGGQNDFIDLRFASSGGGGGTGSGDVVGPSSAIDGHLAVFDTTTGKLIRDGGVPGGGGHTIEEEGSPLTARTNLNFIGTGITATDNVGDDATDVTVAIPIVQSTTPPSAPIDGELWWDPDDATPEANSGHVIEDEGTPLAAEPNLDFAGSGVTVTDVPGSTKTLVTIPGGGSDTVKVTTGIGNIVIPGLAGSPDIVPSSPNANDDEFDALTLSGWTTLGTLDVRETTSILSNVHMKRTNSSTWRVDGIYKAAPSTPFTVSIKISDALLDQNYNAYGILLTEAGPGKLYFFGLLHQSSSLATIGTGWWNSLTSRNTCDERNILWRCPMYYKLVVHSSSNIDSYFSHNGLVWSLYNSGVNPGFTIANVGLMLTGNDNATTNECFVDWIRFA